MGPYHVSLLSENAIIQTLRSHPLHRQLYASLTGTLSEVVFHIHILRETKVGNFDDKMNINPAWRVGNSFGLMICRWLRYKMLEEVCLTCNSWLQDLGG